MLKIFKKHNHNVLPTVLDASNKNPVEQHHQTISGAVQATSIHANPLIEFWPHCSLHAVRTFNSLPSQGIVDHELKFHVHQFSTNHVGTIPKPCSLTNCGLTLMDDSAFKRSHITAANPASISAELPQNLKSLSKRFEVPAFIRQKMLLSAPVHRFLLCLLKPRSKEGKPSSNVHSNQN